MAQLCIGRVWVWMYGLYEWVYPFTCPLSLSLRVTVEEERKIFTRFSKLIFSTRKRHDESKTHGFEQEQVEDTFSLAQGTGLGAKWCEFCVEKEWESVKWRWNKHTQKGRKRKRIKRERESSYCCMSWEVKLRTIHWIVRIGVNNWIGCICSQIQVRKDQKEK